MIQVPQNVPKPAHSPTVLVVDDTAIVRHILEKMLTNLGFQVLTVADGAAAMDLLGKVSVDAIVTDLEMPDVCGDELIEAVRGSDEIEIRELPILVISSRSDEVTRAELRHLGADAFLPKPVDQRRFTQTFSRIFDAA